MKQVYYDKKRNQLYYVTIKDENLTGSHRKIIEKHYINLDK